MPDLYKTPGVYIEELPATGPISGVGTSTAAFIGPALTGPLKVPTKITNWSQFKDNFGEYITSPRHFMAYAVEGFFKNGGTVAYIVRVGTAVKAFKELDDRLTPTPGKALRVEAKEEGTAGNAITVQVQDAQIVPLANNAKAVKEEATIVSAANNLVKVSDVNDADDFRPGDYVTVEGTTERVMISRIRGDEIFLEANLTGSYSSGTLRIADLAAGQKIFRVANGNGLEAGSVIEISQESEGASESKVIDKISSGFITLSQGLDNTYAMSSGDEDVKIQSYEFTLTIKALSQPDENFANLSMDSRHSRYFSKIVNSNSVTVSLPSTPSTAVPPDNRPAVLTPTNPNVTNGATDNLNTIGASHYQEGLDALKRVDDVNILCIPDRTDATVQQAMITHCENMGDRFAVLSSSPNASLFGEGSVLEERKHLESKRGYSALYYPWLYINDPQSSNGQMILVPPSGHIAGIYARSDKQRGVHKAPANEMIKGALKLEQKLTEEEQGELNIEGINVLRVFPNRARPMVWGARTTAPAAEAPWRYINVRRLFLYIEESIQEGIQWAVFEPHDIALWEKLKRTISEFLTRVWRSGALFGATPEQAFYVKCDEELNPSYVRALGQVFVEIGIAPVRPAEFIVIRIGMWEGGSEVME